MTETTAALTGQAYDTDGYRAFSALVAARVRTAGDGHCS